jgi:hypothetical protein
VRSLKYIGSCLIFQLETRHLVSYKIDGGRAERELSQLAAGGMTSDGWNDFKAGWSGGVLRIGTIRAPGLAVRQGGRLQRPGQRQFGVDEWGKGCLKLWAGFMRHEKRWRATAVQDAGALPIDYRTARSVLECASPLALWRETRFNAKALGMVGRSVL